MSPRRVVSLALERGIDVIAVCDHNSAENAVAVARAAAGTRLAVIHGMEITSREEVHVLGLFPDESAAEQAQDWIYRHLEGENDPSRFGAQIVMNEDDEVVCLNQRLLIGATDLGLGEIVREVHRLGGLAVASHADRPRFSIVSQLGFVPEDLPLDAIEVCAVVPAGVPAGMTVIRSSDAHRPEEIGKRHSRFVMERVAFEEIGLALRGAEGRRVLVE
jgi:hypothetical protein